MALFLTRIICLAEIHRATTWKLHWPFLINSIYRLRIVHFSNKPLCWLVREYIAKPFALCYHIQYAIKLSLFKCIRSKVKRTWRFDFIQQLFPLFGAGTDGIHPVLSFTNYATDFYYKCKMGAIKFVRRTIRNSYHLTDAHAFLVIQLNW